MYVIYWLEVWSTLLASFAIPIIQHLHLNKGEGKRSGIKALILTPTRELALQISECIEDYSKYTRIRHGVIFGGVNQRPQVDMLHKGIDILVATPGRLLDLMNQAYAGIYRRCGHQRVKF